MFNILFLTRATSTSGHLIKDSETGVEPVGKEKSDPCPVEVATFSTEVYSPLNVSSYIKQGQDYGNWDFPIVRVTGELTIKSKTGEEPHGITVLDDETILICYESGISRYDKAGLLLGRVKKNTENFFFPSDVCKLADGKVLVLDKIGFHLLDKSLLFIRTLKENRDIDESGSIILFCSLAEDEDGNILTLNNRFTSDKTPTRASVFVFELENEEFGQKVKVIPLEPLIDEAMIQLKISDSNASMCENLTYRNGRMYITGDEKMFLLSVFIYLLTPAFTDSGLHCIYTINVKEDLENCSMIGYKGKELGAFLHPTKVVVDDEGNMIVCDVKNHRLQVLRESEEEEEEFPALIKPDLDSPFTSPSISFLDHKRKRLYVGNKLSKRVVRYRFDE